MYNDYLGNDFIGQNALRQKINFWLDGYKKTKFLDNLMFIGERGTGKTEICRKIGKALGKNFLEINGASIKNLSSFLDQIIFPYIANDAVITLFIDEFACIDKKVQDWLLSALQYNPVTKCSEVQVDNGATLNFNFNNLTVITSTTNPEKLSTPLKSRFRRLEFDPYTLDELSTMVKRYSKDIVYKDKTEAELAYVSRGSPREISLRLANDVKQYLSQKQPYQNEFSFYDWKILRSILSIRPLGINPYEEKLLRTLAESPKTLTNLTGIFNMDTATLRKEIELYPMSKGLIIIQQKRQITKRGIELLKNIDAWRNA